VTAPDGGPHHRAPDRDRLLVDLGTEVRALRENVERVRRNTADTAGVVAEFAPQVLDLQEDMARVRAELDALVDQPEIKNPPIDWVALPAEDAEREWDKLGHWVHEVLGGWYEITRAQLPDCWALHRPAFLHVSWLRTSHVEAYLARSHPSQAAEWNTRWLDAALEKIKETIPDTRCRAAAGRPGDHNLDALEEQQRRSRLHGDLAERGRQLREQAARSAPPPGQPGASPYSDPAYAQPATPPEPAEPRHGDSPGRQVIQLDYWRGYFDQAMQADLAQRRQREAEQQQADAARRSEADPHSDNAP
jgi:hypothetical protein